MIPFHSLHVTPKQDYLYFIHFHFFPFLYFKTSNQGYLISFHSILFHSFHLLKYIPFHSILLWTLKRALKWNKVESKPRRTDLEGTTFLTKKIGIMHRILIIHCLVIEIQQLSIVSVTRTSEVKWNKIYRWWIGGVKL